MKGLYFLFFLLFLFLSSSASKLPKRPKNLQHFREDLSSSSPFSSFSSSPTYFDPHIHYSGILPWRAYSNLTAYIHHEPLNFSQSLVLWDFINQTFYSTSDPLPVFSTSSRVGAGAYATLSLFQNKSEFKENPEILYGILERLLTTSPYTEFDSAYEIRGTISDSKNPISYFLNTLYPNDPITLNSEMCDATLMTLKQTLVSSSEQSLSLSSYKWTEDKQCSLQCLTALSNHPHKLLLMGKTNRFAYSSPTEYLSFDPSGECKPALYFSSGERINLEHEASRLVGSLRTYLSSSDSGLNPCLEWLEEVGEEEVWDVLLGLDHATPEVNCYTAQGMEYLKDLSLKLFQEVKWRDEQGRWGSKPLVNHVHVGEGFSIYYAKQKIFKKNATFDSVFGQGLPGYPPIQNILGAVAQHNVRLVVQAIDQMIHEYEEMYGSVVFRLGHLTHIDKETADLLANICEEFPGLVEADIDLDSNLATEAYTISSGFPVNEILASVLEKKETNFLANHLSKILIPDATNYSRVGMVLGNFTSLKYLLMAGVPVLLPVMLGSDSAGTEHSPIARQYELAASLIEYWNKVDPDFAALEIDTSYFEESVKIHKTVMGSYQDNQPQEPSWLWMVILGFGVGLVLMVVLTGIVGITKRRRDDYEELLD